MALGRPDAPEGGGRVGGTTHRPGRDSDGDGPPAGTGHEVGEVGVGELGSADRGDEPGGLVRGEQQVLGAEDDGLVGSPEAARHPGPALLEHDLHGRREAAQDGVEVVGELAPAGPPGWAPRRVDGEDDLAQGRQRPSASALRGPVPRRPAPDRSTARPPGRRRPRGDDAGEAQRQASRPVVAAQRQPADHRRLGAGLKLGEQLVDYHGLPEAGGCRDDPRAPLLGAQPGNGTGAGSDQDSVGAADGAWLGHGGARRARPHAHVEAPVSWMPGMLRRGRVHGHRRPVVRTGGGARPWRPPRLGACSELPVDVLHVGLDRVEGHAERVGDLDVREPDGNRPRTLRSRSVSCSTSPLTVPRAAPASGCSTTVRRNGVGATR